MEKYGGETVLCTDIMTQSRFRDRSQMGSRFPFSFKGISPFSFFTFQTKLTSKISKVQNALDILASEAPRDFFFAVYHHTLKKIPGFSFFLGWGGGRRPNIFLRTFLSQILILLASSVCRHPRGRQQQRLLYPAGVNPAAEREQQHR